VLSRPTTEQILLDCCRELMEGVLPVLTDEPAQVRVVMLDTVLRNMAVRSAHEIAWMDEECAATVDYAQDVLAATPDAAAPGAIEIRDALDAYAKAPADSWHLDAVVERYCRAGKAFSAALELAVEHGPAELLARGEELLEVRAGRETEVMAGWSPTGR
jgi:thioesterase domain-containing protein